MVEFIETCGSVLLHNFLKFKLYMMLEEVAYFETLDVDSVHKTLNDAFLHIFLRDGSLH